MAEKTYDARVKWKRDTSANWTSNDPVLLNGEIIIVDTSAGDTRFKIGDGTKKYSQLPFEDEVVRSLISGKVDKVSGKELSSNDYTDAEKSKLSGIAAGANKYTHPSYTSRSSGLYKLTVDSTGHISAASAVTKADITALGIPGADTNTTYSAFKGATSSAAGGSGLVPAPSKGASNRYLRSDGTWQVPPDTNTTYSVATTSASGLMSSADKAKLNGIEAGANNTTVDSALSSSSANPVQNKVINAALAGKADSDHEHAQYLKSVSTQEIESGDDLNDYRTPGTYVCRNGTISASVANLPFTGSGFILYVVSAYALSVSQTTVMQIAIDAGGRNIVCIRRVDDEGATQWTQIADISDITLGSVGVTATAAELNKLDGCTATTKELNYVDGVTSNIQTQLNGKAASNHTHNYLPLSGGTLSGPLGVDMTVGGDEHRAQFSSSGTSGGAYISHKTNGVEDNYLMLTGSNTVTKIPLALSSGGTGASSAAAARANLGITPTNIGAAEDDHVHDEYLSCISNNLLEDVDLNDYTTPGVYASRSATTSATIANAPMTTSGFMLYIISPYITTPIAGTNVVQIVISGGGDMAWYSRRGSGDTWTGWASFLTSRNDTYTSSEKITNRTWVDGKPIYRLSGVYTGNINQTNPTDISLGIDKIETVIRADVFSKATDGTQLSWFPITYYNGNASMSFLLDSCEENPVLRLIPYSEMNITGKTIVYTFEYTKE